MCCTRLAANTGRKNRRKIAIWAPSHDFVRLYLRNQGMHRQLQKNMLNSNISFTCPHNMVNVGALTAEIGWRVFDTPENFTIFASWLCYCTNVAQRKSTKLCTMFVRLLGWYIIYTFLEPRCKIHFASKSCVLLYCQRHCTAFEQWASTKLCGIVGLQRMELRKFRCSSFPTEGATRGRSSQRPTFYLRMFQ